jgi:hypothetical protein
MNRPLELFREQLAILNPVSNDEAGVRLWNQKQYLFQHRRGSASK